VTAHFMQKIGKITLHQGVSIYHLLSVDYQWGLPASDIFSNNQTTSDKTSKVRIGSFTQQRKSFGYPNLLL